MTGIAGVPRDTLSAIWQHVHRHLAECVKLSMGEFTNEMLWDRLTEGKFQLWLATDGTTVEGITITEVPAAPSPYVTIVFCYGQNGMEWVKDMEREIGEWAKSLGKSKLRIVGRKGWLRVLDGYEETHRVMERSL